MDPCRIRSYLQVACAGLGFEIGEIWWTANEHGSSTVAAIEEKPSGGSNNNGTLVKADGGQQKLRFVQLYTSKSYANRRSMLVTPPEDDEEEEAANGYAHDHSHQDNHHHCHECTAKDLEKHKLSPRLVDAISKTAQVVWANTLKQEGLTGRSDIPLHTAVGMPVALDADGNMCVVVMFSPSNIQSTDEAMEYLQSISRSATSSNIPCLMPAFDNTEHIQHVPTTRYKSNAIRGRIVQQENSFGEGVTARFVSIDDDDDNSGSSTPEEIRGHDLASAPKDCFGIPMLPSFAELGNETTVNENKNQNNMIENNGRQSPIGDVFDEASYGVWSTIMQERPQITNHQSTVSTSQEPVEVLNDGLPLGLNEGVNPAEEDSIDPKSLVTKYKRSIDPKRKEQLEEFCSAFLGMSVFDIADVWVPAGPQHPDCLSHVCSISCSNQSNAISEFKRVSGYTLIKFWSGAVGRAFSSGNPVWSCNPDVYIDKGRAEVFERANIMTSFAVPIISGSRATPVGVVCCYSMIQAGSVPFVLRFVQQALHLLWAGLDNVQPHESVGNDMWRDVGPADLGEMAADVEMQHHFISKKRPYNSISDQQQQLPEVAESDESRPLAAQLESIDFHKQNQASSFSTNHQLQAADEVEENVQELYTYPQQPQPSNQMSFQAMHAFQNHIKEAVRQVGGAIPFTHAHIATTSDGSKRAHVSHQPGPEPTVKLQPAIQLQASHQPPPQGLGQSSPQPHVVQQSGTHSQATYGAAPSQPLLSYQLASHSQMSHQPAPQQESMMHQTSAQHQRNHLSKARKAVQPAPLAMPHALPTRVIKASHHHHPNEFGERNNAQTSTPLMLPSTQSQITKKLAGGWTSATAASSPPPLIAQAQQPFSSAPLPGVGQPTEVPAQMPPQPTPSKLSQNLLDQRMLQSIANQQYQFATNAASIPMLAQSSETSVTTNTSPSQATMAAQHQNQQVNSSSYCSPASGGYPAPEVTQSASVISAINGKAKVCRIEGCDDPAIVRRPYCARHSGNRLCEHEGCTKCAQGSTRFCIAHGGGRRCTFPGCDKGARDKFFCAAHGGGKRCKAEGCNKSAVGGSSLCTAHGGGRRCAVEGCDKSAQSSTKFCVKHGGGKKCAHEGCEKVARGRTRFCAAHGGGIRCKLDGCNRVAIGKMQLCRAHGGGSRPRTKTAAKVPAPPPMPTGAQIYAQPTVQVFQSIERTTPTSV